MRLTKILFSVSAVLLVVAIIVAIVRHQHRREEMAMRQKLQRRDRAMAMLAKAFAADNVLTYSAVSDTKVVYGGREMNAKANIVHSPQSLAITYTKGEEEGLQAGFNQRWFWRQQPPFKPMEPYAEMQQDQMAMAVRRYALMLGNYYADWTGEENIDGRPVEIIELKPLHPVKGAQGPRKRLWIDEQSGLTVRNESYNCHNKLVMSSILDHIDYQPHITASTFPQPQAVLVAAKQRPWTMQDMGDDTVGVMRLTGLRPPTPKQLPLGFTLDHVGMHRCSRGGPTHNIALSEYTDGLNTLTVFAMQLKQHMPATPAGKAAPTKDDMCIPVQGIQSYYYGGGTLTMRDKQGVRLIAVGDLPQGALEKVLDSTPVEAAEPSVAAR